MNVYDITTIQNSKSSFVYDNARGHSDFKNVAYRNGVFQNCDILTVDLDSHESIILE